jgi:hypothetical protein
MVTKIEERRPLAPAVYNIAQVFKEGDNKKG